MWAIKDQQVKNLRAIRGLTRRDRMRNEGIRQETKVRQLRDKIQDTEVVWGDVKRRNEDGKIKWVAEKAEVDRTQTGRP